MALVIWPRRANTGAQVRHADWPSALWEDGRSMVITRRPRSLAAMLVVCAAALLVAELVATQHQEVRDALLLWPLLVVAVLVPLLVRQPRSARHSRSEAALGLAAATLDLNVDVTELHVWGGDIGDTLFRAEIECAHRPPAISVERAGGRVAVEQAPSWPGGIRLEPYPLDIEAVLSSRIEWTLRVRATALSGTLDLRNVRLAEMDLTVGGARFFADLPAPDGPVQVRIAGPGLHVTLSFPAGTPVRVLPNDGWHMETAAWGPDRGAGAIEGGGQADRYDVWLAGSGRCRIVRRAAELAGWKRPMLFVLREPPPA
jgi:hypothetical protein